MLDESQLRTRMQLLEVYFIHEGANKKDAATGAAQKILGRERVGQCVGIQSLSLIGDANDEVLALDFKRNRDALAGIVGVAVEYGVDGGFAHGHADAEGFVLIYAGLAGDLFGGLFDFVDTVKRGCKRVCDVGIFVSPQLAFPSLLAALKSFDGSLLAVTQDVKQQKCRAVYHFTPALPVRLVPMADANARFVLTMLLGTPVTDATGKLRGKVSDVAVATGAEAGKVAGVVVKNREGQQVVAPRDLRRTPSEALELRSEAEMRPLTGEESFLLLRQDLLDRQIIDVHGRKVVRVNDVELEWWNHERGAAGQMEHLRVTGVAVGLRGALRRLLKGLLPQARLDAVVRRVPQRTIPWEFVDIVEVDPARRVKLKIEHERLARLHPSDIADILEELAPAEREALLMSLDEELAADALEEVDPKLQRALLQALDSETAAGIVEEMDPSAAADLLADLSEAESEAILGEMNPEDRREVKDLLEFREDSAAGRMTTEYVAVPQDATVADCVVALREFEGDPETITEIYLLGEHHVLMGVVPLARLVLARQETRVQVLSDPRMITCELDAHQNEVAELFDKYNLRALPVVDKQRRLAGVVEADHVIAFLREGR